MDNTTPHSSKQDHDQGAPKSEGETLAERSARLEAEAQALYNAGSDDDPLSPTTLDERVQTSDSGKTSAADEYAPHNTQSDDAISDFTARIKALEAELDATKDRMLRAVADAENTKRRALKERDDAQKFSISSFARDMLPVADNLRRALTAIPEGEQSDEIITSLLEGVEATERELMRVFERHGLKKLDPIDAIFDPNFHEVMFEAPMPTKPAGTVIQVMETGYTLHGRLLRPARVGVVKDDGQGAGATATEPGHTIDTEA